MADQRDELLRRALEALYWWDDEHGCCRGAQDDMQEAVYAHLTAAGVPVETYGEWADRQKREREAKMDAVRWERGWPPYGAAAGAGA